MEQTISTNKYKIVYGLPVLVLATVLLGACNRAPDNARYIPKDVIAVAGINLKALGKKIAWNMITGSKLFKEMQQRLPKDNAKDAIAGIEKAGIDVANTFYLYVKTDNRYRDGNRVTMLIPLSDAQQWESYVKQVFSRADIRQHGDHKEAALNDELYVGWNRSLLILINVTPADDDDNAASRAGAGATDISAEMEKAFHIAPENSINSNIRFTSLESEGHDLTFWLNYGLLLDKYSPDMADKMGGVTLSNTLWKDAAITCGFDFKKGKIAGDMRYYLSEEMNEIGKEFGAVNVDKDMLDRLPGSNMDMLLATHLAPKGFKALLEKTGLLGLANVGLSAQDITTDEIFDAVTGDMAVVMNDFSLSTETATDNFMGQMVTHKEQKTTMAMTYVIKINNKAFFDKLMNIAGKNGLLPTANGYIMPINDRDSLYMVADGHYFVVSNQRKYASGVLEGSLKDMKMPEFAASQVYGHPLAAYFDITEFFKRVDAGAATSTRDSVMISESGKLLSNIVVNGGQYKNNAYEFHLDINFTNTDENSIIQLLDFGMRMNEADKMAMQ